MSYAASRGSTGARAPVDVTTRLYRIVMRDQHTFAVDIAASCRFSAVDTALELYGDQGADHPPFRTLTVAYGDVVSVEILPANGGMP